MRRPLFRILASILHTFLDTKNNARFFKWLYVNFLLSRRGSQVQVLNGPPLHTDIYPSDSLQVYGDGACQDIWRMIEH